MLKFQQETPSGCTDLAPSAQAERHHHDRKAVSAQFAEDRKSWFRKDLFLNVHLFSSHLNRNHEVKAGASVWHSTFSSCSLPPAVPEAAVLLPAEPQGAHTAQLHKQFLRAPRQQSKRSHMLKLASVRLTDDSAALILSPYVYALEH